MDEYIETYRECRVCPRACGVDRSRSLGVGRVPDRLFLARAALHRWEEPPISGTRGSGAVFFAGCSLGCEYCQNRAISRAAYGKEITADRLVEIFLALQREGAHNINLVTPTHYAPHLLYAIPRAREKGLRVPIVYNTSSYDSVEMLKRLSPHIDIFLADFKYLSPRLSLVYSHAQDYPTVAKAAIRTMVAARDRLVFDTNGCLLSGTIVRILLLPGALIDAKAVLHYLYTTYKDKIAISLMRQYTPIEGVPPPLDRRVSDSEYLSFLRYAESLGVRNAYTQEKTAASESYIPPFDLTGV